MYFRPDMIRDAKKVRPPMGAKLLALTEGWWPLATKWGPYGPPGWLNLSLWRYVPLLLAPAKGQWSSAT